MRKLALIFLTIVYFGFSASSQAPDFFNYQAVIRDNTGELISEQNVGVRISILDGSSLVLYTEEHSVLTNAYGQLDIKIGDGDSPTIDFSTLDWASGEKYLKVEIDVTGGDNYTALGAVQLLSVPYALYAKNVENKDDADADATNEIQDLNLTGNILTITDNASATQIDLAPYQGTNTDAQTLSLSGTELSITGGNIIDVSSLKDDADADPDNEIQILSISNDTIYLANGGFVKLPFDNIDDDDNSPTNELQTLLLDGDTLEITNGNSIVFPYDSVRWELNGDKMYYNTGNVGIGTSTPNSKLEVKADASFTENDTLFAVKDKDGNIVFAVFPDGAKVYVNDGAKGTVGGFAVSGRNTTKGLANDYFVITPDSARIYINDTLNTKGKVGGFAVSGRNTTKGLANDYFVITPDSARIYINDTIGTKGTVGGFAVSGRNTTKGLASDYLVITPDSARIYINDTIGTKGTVGGFAVSGRNTTKGTSNNIFLATVDSTRIYVDETGTKGTVGGFAVSGRNTTKGATSKFMDMTKENYFIGHESGQKTTDGLYNSFMGYESGFSNTLGSNNSFIGYRTGYNNLSGNNNTFLGDSSGFGNTEGSGNLFVGKNSGISNTDGSYNSFLGYESGYSNTIGLNNSFVGSYSGYSNISGFNNSFVGESAGYNNVSGEGNSFIGIDAGYENTIGDFNSYLGYRTGYTCDTGSYNVLVGYQSGYNNTNDNNVFIGYQCGYNNANDNNVFIGTAAGRTNTNGYENVFIGTEAGFSTTNGGTNIFIGHRAGWKNENGVKNVYMGVLSGYNNIGSENVYIGDYTGYSGTSAYANVLVGANAGWYNTASYNVFIGRSAGYNNTYGGVTGDEGSKNVFVGAGAGLANSSGYFNTAVGYSAFSDGFNYVNSTGIGYDAEPGASNTIRLGNASVSTIGGAVSWSILSDKRFKTNIKENVIGIDFIMKLRPITYNLDMEAIAYFNNTPDSLRLAKNESLKAAELQIGFIAQEVEAAAMELGFDFHGVDKPKNKTSHYGLRYSEFVVPLVKGMQEQQQIIENQKIKISELEDRLNKIEKLLLTK